MPQVDFEVWILSFHRGQPWFSGCVKMTFLSSLLWFHALNKILWRPDHCVLSEIIVLSPSYDTFLLHIHFYSRTPNCVISRCQHGAAHRHTLHFQPISFCLYVQYSLIIILLFLQTQQLIWNLMWPQVTNTARLGILNSSAQMKYPGCT